MRALHTPHALHSFPVYSSAFLSDHDLILGGGGGASRTGIKNKLRIYRIASDRSLDLVNELELAKDEDAPMSMTVHTQNRQLICGINSAEEMLKKGQNENCRVYGTNDNKLTLMRMQGTLTSGDVEDYQKVTVLSRDEKLVAAAGIRDFSILLYPSLSPVTLPVQIRDGELYDATFSLSNLVMATTVNLLVYAIPKPSSSSNKKKGKGKQKVKTLPDLELLRTIEVPTLPGVGAGSTFRAARFHPIDNNILYAILNTVPQRSRKTKASLRQAFICKWNTATWEVLKIRKIGDRGLTCFDISGNGKFLAFGSSDNSIGLLDANTLAPLLTILKAHDFPSTTLRFNPSSTLLVSGSADNSLRIISVPDSLGGTSWTTTLFVATTLLVILLAVIVHILLAKGMIKW